jgi:Flp pilus assembly protein TadG
MTRPVRQRRGDPAHCQTVSGTVAIEFALLSPLLMILLTGLIEIGMAAFQSMQVQAAAEAGALYAANHGTSDINKIIAAVASATSTPGITASPVPLAGCGCPTASGVVFQNCTTVCADTKAPGTYVTVIATITRTKLLTLPYITLPLPTQLVGRSVMRTQ